MENLERLQEVTELIENEYKDVCDRRKDKERLRKYDEYYNGYSDAYLTILKLLKDSFPALKFPYTGYKL